MSDMAPGLEQLLRDAAGPALASETRDEAVVLAAFRHARNNAALAPVPVRRRLPRLTLKLGGLTAGALLGFTAIGAAANVLPHPVQSIAAATGIFPEPKPQPGATLQADRPPVVPADVQQHLRDDFADDCRRLVADQLSSTAIADYASLRDLVGDEADVLPACRQLVAVIGTGAVSARPTTAGPARQPDPSAPVAPQNSPAGSVDDHGGRATGAATTAAAPSEDSRRSSTPSSSPPPSSSPSAEPSHSTDGSGSGDSGSGGGSGGSGGGPGPGGGGSSGGSDDGGSGGH